MLLGFHLFLKAVCFKLESSDPKGSRTFLCFTTFSSKGLYSFFTFEKHWLGGQEWGLSLPACPLLIVTAPGYIIQAIWVAVSQKLFRRPFGVIFLPVSSSLQARNRAKKGGGGK